MAEDTLRISLLPDETRAKVSSSFEITTPEAVIEGLVRNALDADGRSVVIDADFAKGYLTISDNGTGIREIEFMEQGQLAKLHCSSRFNTPYSTYGRYGRFLSSLSYLCLLSISSQHRSESSASRIVLHRGVVINRQTGMCQEEVGLGRQGTRIVVHNLFGDIPVRFKQLSMRYASSSETERAFERVKLILVGYLLAYPQSVELRFSFRGEKQQTLRCNVPRLNDAHFSLESIISVLFQANLLGALDTTQWRSASVRCPDFSIRAVISIIPSPSKTAQFISVGNFPLRRRQGFDAFFDTIDRLFAASNFGSLDNKELSPGEGARLQESAQEVADTGRLGKGVDRCPVFYLRIDTKSERIPWLLGQDEPAADALPIIDHLMKALESLISHFLNASGFARKTKLGNARKVRSRKNRIHDSSDHLPSPELSRGATEARFLNQWHRVKSARPSEENFRYGLGFDKPKDDLEPVAAILEEELPVADQLPQEMRHDTAENDLPGIGNDLIDDVISLLWTNPRNGQVVHLNPRTGAIMPKSMAQFPFLWESCWEHTAAQQHFRRTQEWRRSPLDRAKHRPIDYAIKLDKYLQRVSFQGTEAPIACIASGELSYSSERPQATRLEINVTRAAQAVTRSALSTARIIQQVDQKFVLVTVTVSDKCAADNGETTLAVLIDQHAADERVKFEQLCRDFCRRTPTTFSKPLIFEVDANEAKLLEELKAYFQLWSLDYNLVEGLQHSSGPRKRGFWTLEVTTLPSLIAERCRGEPKLLIDLIRRELWSGRPRRRPSTIHAVKQDEQAWWSEISHCPEGVIEMLKSRSCRTAIMFNDVLNIVQCRELVQKLSLCNFPFQCAHGRPTLTVLADLVSIDGMRNTGSIDMPNNNTILGYGDAWSDWVDFD